MPFLNQRKGENESRKYFMINLHERSMFGVNWLLGLEGEAKNRFSRRLPCRPSWILAIFYLQVTPMLPSKFGVNWPFGSGEEAKNRFSRWRPWWPSIFDLQVTLMLPSKFGVNWPFGSGEEAKNRFSRWRPWRPSWISSRHNFSYF